MGLLRWGWLKRRKSMVGSKRRESEPPMTNFDPNSNRESYLKAFGQFQERRLWPRQDHEHSESSGEADPVKLYESSDIYASITRDSANYSSKQDLNDDSPSSAGGCDFDDKNYYNIKDNRTRRSLPAKLSKALTATRKQSQATKNINNNSVIFEDEAQQFESLHCNNNISRLGENLPSPRVMTASPPAKFFKNNSHPFVTPPPLPPPNATVKPEQYVQRGTVVSTKRNRFIPRHLRVGSATSSSGGGQDDTSSSGSYLNFDDNSSALSDAFAGNGNGKKFSKRRYEHDINMFGELVEYAVPEAVSYSDRETDSQPDVARANNEPRNALLPSPPPAPPGSPFFSFTTTTNNNINCDGIIDDNFDFLNQNSCQSDKQQQQQQQYPIEAPPLGQSVRITDLDESFEGELNGRRKTDSIRKKNVFQELKSLESWSESHKSHFSSFEMDEKYKCSIAMCKPKDIKYSGLSKFGHRLDTHLEFSSGTYRKATVTIRKCNAHKPETVRLAEEAIERDYNILKSNIRHPSIVMLMAASYNKNLINHMIVVLEPADYTLNYFLHQLDDHLEPNEVILVAQQIANAAQYLHQFGYIHSNISSHCVLMCNHRVERHLNVKLSSFELVTAIDHRLIAEEIECKYGQVMADGRNAKGSAAGLNVTGYSFVKHRKQALLHKYRKRSKELKTGDCLTIDDHSYLNVRSDHLPYNLNYRQHLSQFNYQAPELLASHGPFVFPSTGSDVYAITVLLWEMINRCVPYAVYSAAALVALLAKRQAYLPMFESACSRFSDIFSEGLECNPNKRTMHMDALIKRLESVRIKVDSESHYQNGAQVKMATTLPSSSRLINLTTDKPLPPVPMSAEEINSINGGRTNFTNCTLYQSLLEFNKFLTGNAMTPAGERTSTLKKRKQTSRANSVTKPVRGLFVETENSRDVKANETLDELNQNLDTIASRDDATPPKASPIMNSKTAKAAIVGPLLVKENRLPTKLNVTREKTKFLNQLLSPRSSNEALDITDDDKYSRSARKSPRKTDNSKSVDNLLDDTPPLQTHQQSTASIAPSPSSYRFSIGDFTIPSTPIARKNKIRRNAWLSDQQLSIDEDGRNDNEQSFAQPSNHQADDQEPHKNKRFNVSIKIVHNKVTPNEKCQAPIETASPPPLFYDQRPLTPHRLNHSDTMTRSPGAEPDNLTAEYTKCLTSSLRPEVSNNFRDIMQKMESSDGTKKLPTPRSNGAFEKHWRREKEICRNSESMTDAMSGANKFNDTESPFTPVKDTIQQFENWLSVNKTNSPVAATPPLLRRSYSSMRDMPSKPPRNTTPPKTTKETNTTIPAASSTLITRTVYRESIVSGIDMPACSLFDADSGISGGASSNNSTMGRKLTTCVTMNMRKTRRRASDIGLEDCKLPLPNTRHSIGVANECDALLGLESFSASSTLAKTDDAKACSRAQQQQKAVLRAYVSCNCEAPKSIDDGSTELIRSNDERLSASRSFYTSATDTLRMFQNSSSFKLCQLHSDMGSFQNIRSTEDLYIDDDFGYGNLGANMELVADTSDLFDVNYDINLTEIYQQTDGCDDQKQES